VPGFAHLPRGVTAGRLPVRRDRHASPGALVPRQARAGESAVPAWRSEA